MRQEKELGRGWQAERINMRRNLEEKKAGNERGGGRLQGPATQPRSYSARRGIGREEKVYRNRER